MCLQFFFGLTIGASKGALNINIRPLEQKNPRTSFGFQKMRVLFSAEVKKANTGTENQMEI